MRHSVVTHSTGIFARLWTVKFEELNKNIARVQHRQGRVGVFHLGDAITLLTLP
jgi:hypothetical protein